MLLRVLLFLTSLYLISAQCASGSFQNTTSNICEKCPAGTYSDVGAVGLIGCKLCPTGQFSYAGRNCTTCTTGSCLPGSVQELQQTESVLSAISPFAKFNIQSLKVGFVFIPFLLFVFPLVVAAFTCWQEEFFRLFDVYQNVHLISDGAPRVKQRTGLGGCCFLFAASLFAMLAGAAIVDFYFDNVRREDKLTISPDSSKTAPFGSFSYIASIKLLGLEKEDCYATYSTTGYNVLSGSEATFACAYSAQVVTKATSDPLVKIPTNDTTSTCTCTYHCKSCSINPAQKISLQFPSKKVFTSAIHFNYKTPFAGNYHQIDGSILPPTGQVFYGSTPTNVKITHFSSIYKGLLGGANFAGLAHFVNTFVNIHNPSTLGVTSQVDLVTKGSAVHNFTGAGGLSVDISGSFSDYDYLVEEFLSQTFINHVGGLVGIFIVLIVCCYFDLMILEYFIQLYEHHDNNGNLKKLKKLILKPYKDTVRFLKSKITGKEVLESSSSGSDEDSDSNDDAEDEEDDENIDLYKQTSEIAELQAAVKILTDKLTQLESEKRFSVQKEAPKEEKHEEPTEKIETLEENKVGEVTEEILLE